MRRVPDTAQHALAAEYVLGTMRGRARRRFEALRAADRTLSDVVSAWEAMLTPLVDRIEPIEPPERVWKAIEARIGVRAAPAAASPSIWSSLAFWRGMGTALAVALVALVVMLPRPPAPSAPAPAAPVAVATTPTMVALLATPEADLRMVVERHADRLKVRVVKPWKDMPGQDLELWAIPKDGKPRSLGVVRYDRDSEVTLANLDEKLTGTVAFAISREPAGGSPSPDGPTGPVLCSGAIARSA